MKRPALRLAVALWGMHGTESAAISYTRYAHMEIHRVKIVNFSFFEVNRRILRWFKQEFPTDYVLRVSDVGPEDTCVLWAHAFWAEPHSETGLADFSEAGRLRISPEPQPLDQPTVDKIERSTAATQLLGCDFVIFENSPKSRAECQAEDQ